MKYITTIDEKDYSIEVLDEKHIIFEGKTLEVDFESVSGQPVYSLIVDGKSYEAYVYQAEDTWEVLRRGHMYTVKVEDEREKRLRAAAGGNVSETGDFLLKAPMPGMVVAIPVKEGQGVQKGDVLLILESMKMQNELKAPRDGTVARMRVQPGESVEQRQILLSIE